MYSKFRVVVFKVLANRQTLPRHIWGQPHNERDIKNRNNNTYQLIYEPDFSKLRLVDKLYLDLERISRVANTRSITLLHQQVLTTIINMEIKWESNKAKTAWPSEQ